MKNALQERMARVKEKRRKESRRILSEKLEQAKRILVTEFCPKRIILCGSLAGGSEGHPCFDLDPLFEGLGEDYLKAGGRLLDALGEVVDLKPLEMLEPGFRDHVLKHGEILYETAIGNGR